MSKRRRYTFATRLLNPAISSLKSDKTRALDSFLRQFSAFLGQLQFGLAYDSEPRTLLDRTDGTPQTRACRAQAQAQLAGPFHSFVESTATKERDRSARGPVHAAAHR